MRWSRLSSLLQRQLDRIVHPRLTEILVEVADIRVGAGEACPFRVGIRAGARARPLHGGARVAAVFASLPAAVTGIGVRLGFRGRLCSLPGPRTLAVVVLRTGLGRGLARLAVVVLRTGPGRGLARLAVLVPLPGPRLAALLVPRPGVAPTHAFGWASVGVDGHGPRPPEKQADGEEECCSLRRQLAQEQRRGLYQSLDTQVPNWREIDNSPEWRQWLAQPHELSGRTRQEWLNDAMAKGDAHRVASFFRGFLQASAAPHRTAVEGQQRQATGGQRIYSRADITRASEDYRRGRYTEEQYRRLSED